MRHLVFDSCWVIGILRFYDLKLAEVKKFQVIFAKFWLLSLKFEKLPFQKAALHYGTRPIATFEFRKKKLLFRKPSLAAGTLKGVGFLPFIEVILALSEGENMILVLSLYLPKFWLISYSYYLASVILARLS